MRPPVTIPVLPQQQLHHNQIHQMSIIENTMSQSTILVPISTTLQTTTSPTICTTVLATLTTTITTPTSTTTTILPATTIRPLSPILLTNDNNCQHLIKVLTNGGRTLLTTNNKSGNIIPPVTTQTITTTTTTTTLINTPITVSSSNILTKLNDNLLSTPDNHADDNDKKQIKLNNDLISSDNNSVLLHYHNNKINNSNNNNTDKDNLFIKKQQQSQTQLTLNDNNCCNTLNENLSDILSENLSDINNKKHIDCNVFTICNSNSNNNNNNSNIKKLNCKRNNEKLLLKNINNSNNNNNNFRLSNNNNNNNSSVVKKLKRQSADGVCLIKPSTNSVKKITSEYTLAGLTVNKQQQQQSNSVPKLKSISHHHINHNNRINYNNIIDEDNLEKTPLLLKTTCCSPSLSPTPPSSPTLVPDIQQTTDDNLINLKKSNNTSLIFTKKQCNNTTNDYNCDFLLKSGKRYRINKVKDKPQNQQQQQQHQKQKRHSYHNTFSLPTSKTDTTFTTDLLLTSSSSVSSTSKTETPIITPKIFKHDNVEVTNDSDTRTTSRQICHSWYGGNGTAYDILFEELDQHLPADLLDRNLAGSRQNVSNGTRESASLLESDNQTTIQLSRIKQQQQQQQHLIVSSGVNGGSTNEISAHPPSLVTQTPRLRRFEQLLKTLIGGKKASKDATTSPPLLPTKQTNATTTPPLVDNSKLITKTTSEHSLNAHGCTQKSNNHHSHHRLNVSTSSLNSVHQKLWTVVPLLKREGSCASLSHTKTTPVAEYSGMRKCETVLALTHSTTSNSLNLPTRHQLQHQHSLQHNPYHHHSQQQQTPATTPTSSEPIKPLNRLRNCASISTCSRCSSLLSLAATAGSRYSLNVSSGGFVVVNGASSSSNSNNSDVIDVGNDSNTSSGSSGISGCGIDDNDDDFLLSKIPSKTKKILSAEQLPSTQKKTQILLPLSSPSAPPPPPIIILSEEYEQPITLIQQFACKLCLAEVKIEQLTKIAQCGCTFCTECMNAYVEFEILEGAYEISCPDAMCPAQGILTLNEIQKLSSNSLMEKHQRYRLNREVELDKNRTWCPKAGCETICTLQPNKMITSTMVVEGGGPSSSSSSVAALNVEKSLTMKLSASSNDMSAAAAGTSSVMSQGACVVHCPTCFEDFCSGCKKTWHPTMTCEENTRRLAADGNDDSFGIPFDSDLIKCCPMCTVPIEKDEGCAQMMCKRCKHVFCWYCLASLDDDFLLRHYDKGPCKNKLGHSRASVVWHRAQVIGIFAGFGILLLVASPLLLLAAPCIVCCKCRICNGAARLEDNDGDYDEGVALHR